MNIYVGNLNYKVNETDLQEVFEDYGTVTSAKIIMDKYSGRSKGFGFVTMEDQDAANKAIEELNGATYEEREMVVNVARERKENFNR